jgi:hypothetical protein
MEIYDVIDTKVILLNFRRALCVSQILLCTTYITTVLTVYTVFVVTRQHLFDVRKQNPHK